MCLSYSPAVTPEKSIISESFLLVYTFFVNLAPEPFLIAEILYIVFITDKASSSLLLV